MTPDSSDPAGTLSFFSSFGDRKGSLYSAVPKSMLKAQWQAQAHPRDMRNNNLWVLHCLSFHSFYSSIKLVTYVLNISSIIVLWILGLSSYICSWTLGFVTLSFIVCLVFVSSIRPSKIENALVMTIYVLLELTTEPSLCSVNKCSKDK